jgi:origin recognition complex subunit 2
MEVVVGWHEDSQADVLNAATPAGAEASDDNSRIVDQDGQEPPAPQQQDSMQMIPPSLLYPGIQDWVALKVLQCTYRFQDHQFLGLQWKALQNAHWTYDSRKTSGRYQSPQSTYAFESANAVQEFLDQFAIPMIHSDLQPLQPIFVDERYTDASSLEHGKELRNQVCYHMQLLLEKSQGEYLGNNGDESNENNVDKNREPSSGSTAKTDTGAPNETTTTYTVRNRRSMRNATVTATPYTSSTITATADKGSNLYLHKKQQASTSATQQRRRRSKKSNHDTHSNHPNDLDDDDEIYDPSRAFSSREQCIERIQHMDTDSNRMVDTDHPHPVSTVQGIEAWYRKECFADWAFQLSTNHSLLFYGNGSKYELLNEFGDMELSQHGTVLKLDGFAPDITIEGILDVLVDIFLDGTEPEPAAFGDSHSKENASKLLNSPILEPCSTVVDRAGVIAKALARYCFETLEPIYLILHNIDGPNLCTDIAQDALAALVVNGIPERGSVTAIRFVASMDHVGASSTLWSPFTNFHFRWLWKEVNTHRPYVHELIVLPEEEMASKNSKASRNRKNESSLEQKTGRIVQVLKNLAPRHGEVMQVLAKLQLKVLNQQQQQTSATNIIASSVQSPTTPWVDYKLFRAECKKNFLIDKDAKLRLLLTELQDHQMLQMHYEGSSEYVCIPYTSDKLQEILAMPSRSLNNK